MAKKKVESNKDDALFEALGQSKKRKKRKSNTLPLFSCNHKNDALFFCPNDKLYHPHFFNLSFRRNGFSIRVKVLKSVVFAIPMAAP